MSDYSELKRLAEDTKGWDNLKSCWPEETEDGDLEVNWFVGAVIDDDDKYPVLEVNTAQYDALEDAGRLARFYAAANPAAVLALITDLDEARNGMKHSSAIRLKKEIERLEGERDQIKAENAGLKTGYEAYEQVVQGLKAENEALRNALMECVDSLQGEMLQKFGGQLPEDMHPVTRREYDRDVAEISGYRAAIGKGEQS
ncbi:hypothetical protein PS662_04360 [Pseudomonas fluorescens]|uniref:Ead/Ea22-like family protein n=1 Tax=Pseudomonas fluorescens TaxID=294 RepID=A0A5E6VTK1_PSEFL|nr:hypothetical protein [Pseudomonas fluorescens]VVN20878.1 hypothetical protein PS662_04360 [Pseudomonas fluorescens]